MSRAILASCLTVLGTLTLQFPAAATAQDMTVRTVKVSTADLDLASPLGKRTFDQRVTRAIGIACGGYGESDFAIRATQAACRAKARRDVAPQVLAALDAPQRRGATVLASAQITPAR